MATKIPTNAGLKLVNTVYKRELPKGLVSFSSNKGITSNSPNRYRQETFSGKLSKGFNGELLQPCRVIHDLVRARVLRSRESHHGPQRSEH